MQISYYPDILPRLVQANAAIGFPPMWGSGENGRNRQKQEGRK